MKILLAALTSSFMLVGCTPRIEVAAPKEPITINMNVKIEHEIIIKELGPDGVYRYATAPKPAEHTFSAKLNLIFRQCITSVDYAQNMIVVKTMPGLANGAASAIDKLNIPEMLGTLAGDDTCFVVLKDTQAAAELCAEIREQIEH